MAVRVGHVLRQRYRIDALLGQGGMGAVYRATDLALNITVAVKENLVSSPGAQEQFGREARILAALRHPSLPRVSDHFSIRGQGQYLVMDYVGGEDLNQILARVGPVPEAQAVAWMGQILDALAYLHSRQIIHRDVKPANVKISSRGQAFLVDFGLAKVHDAYQRTSTGARGVTPGFAPPEQYGQGRTDARTDIYSAGATLYALAAGQAPPDSIDVMMGVRAVTPPQRLNARISPGVERAILRAMQIRPDDRFQSAGEFRAALRAAAGRGQRAAPARGGERGVSRVASAGRRRDAAPAAPAGSARARPGQRDWGLWRRWLGVTTVGWALGWMAGTIGGGFLGGQIGQALAPDAFLSGLFEAIWAAGLAGPAVGMAAGGVGQGLLLRKRFRWAASWLRASALTMVVAVLAVVVGTIVGALGTGPAWAWDAAPFAVVVLDLAVRYLVLRRRTRRAGWWFLAGAIALLGQVALGALCTEIVGSVDILSGLYYFLGAADGALYGAITGLSMIWILSFHLPAGEPGGEDNHPGLASI